MKTGIHPKYNDTILITCACGNVIAAGSTVDSIKTELCSACHPFYTGKQKLVDTAGKVDKFMARVKKAQAYKEQNVKTVEEEEIVAEKEKIEEETVEVKEKPAILNIKTDKEEAEEETSVEEKAEEVEENKPKAAKKTAKKTSKK